MLRVCLLEAYHAPRTAGSNPTSTSKILNIEIYYFFNVLSYADSEEHHVVQGASDVRDLPGRAPDPGGHTHHTVQHDTHEGRSYAEHLHTAAPSMI